MPHKNDNEYSFQKVYNEPKNILMPVVDVSEKSVGINKLITERGESHRQKMLTFFMDSTNLVSELRNYYIADGHSKLRLTVPPEMFPKLQDGSWDLKEAKDGSGLLPIAVDAENNKFVKQVRLKWTSDDLTAKTEMANMAAHAKTHALLRQVLVKLDVINAKLDLVLANQTALWKGKISSGLQTIERVQETRPLNQLSLQRLTNSEQSIREGLHIGIGTVSNHLKALSNKPTLFGDVVGFFSRKPSDMLAIKLDEVIDDVKFLASGMRGLIAIAILFEDENAAQQEIFDFAKEIPEMFEQHNQLIRKAKFDRDREYFLTQNIPALAMQANLGGLVIEFEEKELLYIASEGLR